MQTYTHRLEDGWAVGNFYGWRVDGLKNSTTWNVVGAENSDPSEDNKTIIGNGMPKMFAALQASYRWKGLDVSVSFRGAFGFDILNAYTRLAVEFQRAEISLSEDRRILQFRAVDLFGPLYRTGRLRQTRQSDHRLHIRSFTTQQGDTQYPGLLYGHEPAYDQRLFWAGPRSGDRRPHIRRGPDQQIP